MTSMHNYKYHQQSFQLHQVYIVMNLLCGHSLQSFQTKANIAQYHTTPYIYLSQGTGKVKKKKNVMQASFSEALVFTE